MSNGLVVKAMTPVQEIVGSIPSSGTSASFFSYRLVLHMVPISDLLTPAATLLRWMTGIAALGVGRVVDSAALYKAEV